MSDHPTPPPGHVLDDDGNPIPYEECPFDEADLELMERIRLDADGTVHLEDRDRVRIIDEHGRTIPRKPVSSADVPRPGDDGGRADGSGG